MKNHRYNCKFCGRGFLGKSNEINVIKYTCRRAKCEKQAGIYRKSAKTEEIQKSPVNNRFCRMCGADEREDEKCICDNWK